MKAYVFLVFGILLLLAHATWAQKECKDVMAVYSINASHVPAPTSRAGRIWVEASEVRTPLNSRRQGGPANALRTSVELKPEQVEILKLVDHRFQIANRSIVSDFIGIRVEIDAITAKFEEGFELVFSQGEGRLDNQAVSVLSLDFMVADQFIRNIVPGKNRPQSDMLVPGMNDARATPKTRDEAMIGITQRLEAEVSGQNRYLQAKGIQVVLKYGANGQVTSIQIAYSGQADKSAVANAIGSALGTVDRSF